MIPGLAWRRGASSIGLAFTDRFLLGLRPDPEPRVLRRKISDGVISPGPVSPNIRSVRDVATIAAAMLDELGGRRRSVSVLLPDLALVTVLIPPSSGEGGAAARTGLHSRLGFAPSEARSDFWRGKKGELLGAAVRGSVVRQYEQVVEAADCSLGWVDGTSLVRIPRWAERSESEPGHVVQVHVQLYPSHYVMAAFRAGELVDLRVRLRSRDDVDGVVEEVSRLPAIYDIPALGSVAFSGAGAEACAERSRERPVGRASWEDETEEAQLQTTLVELLQRRGLASGRR